MFVEQHKSPAFLNRVSTGAANGTWICHSWKCQRLASADSRGSHSPPSLLPARAISGERRRTERLQSELDIFSAKVHTHKPQHLFRDLPMCCIWDDQMVWSSWISVYRVCWGVTLCNCTAVLLVEEKKISLLGEKGKTTVKKGWLVASFILLNTVE